MWDLWTDLHVGGVPGGGGKWNRASGSMSPSLVTEQTQGLRTSLSLSLYHGASRHVTFLGCGSQLAVKKKILKIKQRTTVAAMWP